MSSLDLEMGDDLEGLAELVREFARLRDWEQFHTPRNLVLALVGEVGELAAEFQWNADDSLAQKLATPAFRESVGSELADVFSYLIRLADVLGMDLGEELRKKISLNNSRYPVDKSRGSAEKYTSYE